MRSKLSFLSIPYVVWMALFVVAPIVMVVFYAFSSAEGGSLLIGKERQELFQSLALTYG